VITIRGWDGLRKYGINILTGEACAYSTRILCDVTHEGKMLVLRTLGLLDATICDNYNSGAIGSMMLPYDLRNTLAIHALLDVDKCGAVALLGDEIVGYEQGDDMEDWTQLLENHAHFNKRGARVIIAKGGPRQGDRMVHMATGRTC
jgi:hypothetical protein